jgi:DNA-binding transcriptional ArsR family regulator
MRRAEVEGSDSRILRPPVTQQLNAEYPTVRIESGEPFALSQTQERTQMPVTKASPKSASLPRTAPSKSRGAKAVDQRFQQARRASILLKHVSDPTRLQVILILSEGERHVGALCDQLSQSQPAVSHHLALLRHGGIIAPRRQGKNNYYSLTDTGAELARVVKNLIA